MEQISMDTAINILDMLDPIALFDRNGKYVYVNKPWLNNCADQLKSSFDLSDLHAWDIFPGSRVKEVLDTHKSIIGEVITIENQNAYVSYCPVYRSGEFDGVLMWELFRGEESIYKAARNATKMVTELRRQLESANSDLSNLLSQDSPICGIIGKSTAIRQLKDEVLAASRTNSTVLIEGETGTGKELVARAIHQLSKKSSGKFVPINCAAIPDSLIEAELFGYEEGAFTGARRGGKPGKFELANKGSLFLDEIHQLSFFAQPKLLRVLQEREIERLAGNRAIPISFRCMAATNADLLVQVEASKFRRDLYYRLNVIQIRLPPLRERREDIPLLVDSMISQLNSRMETNIIMADDDALNMLMEYEWPGNVRELQNVLEAAMNRAFDGVLSPGHFKLNAEKNTTIGAKSNNLRLQKEKIEYNAIRTALLESHGNKAETARQLGMSRSLLYKKMKQYNLIRSDNNQQ